MVSLILPLSTLSLSLVPLLTSSSESPESVNLY